MIIKFQISQYPESIGDGKFTISGIRDLTAGYDSTMPDEKPILPVSKSSQMITFTFDNGFICTIRTSGTEPKIKYYMELISSPKEKLVICISFQAIFLFYLIFCWLK